MNLIDRRAARHSLWMAAGALCAMLTGCDGPDSSDHLARGAKFEAQNDLNAALIEYRSAAAASPNAADARWALGKLLLKLGDGRTAEKEINAALHAGLKDPEAVYAKARAMLIAQDAQAAETYLSQHIPKPPTTRYLITLGDTNAALNKLADATANYTAALELNPKASDALLGLARIHLSQGKA